MPTPDAADPSTAGTFAVTELEVRLRAPDGARLRAKLLARLGNLARELAAAMASGLSAADFARAAAIAKALASAQTVLAMFPAGPSLDA